MRKMAKPKTTRKNLKRGRPMSASEKKTENMEISDAKKIQVLAGRIIKRSEQEKKKKY